MSALSFSWRLPLVFLCACALDVSAPAIGEVSEPLTARDSVLRLDLASPVPAADGILLAGRTSRGLSSAMAFVPDDEVGRTELVEGGFETILPLAELNARLMGSPLFFSMITSEGEQTHAAARFALTLPASCSTQKLKFDREFRSALVDGVPVLRFTGRTTIQNAQLEASVQRDYPRPTFRGYRSYDVFHVDVPLDLATTAALTATPIQFTASAAGSTVTRTCTPRVALTSLALSADDPYEVWPAPTCSAAQRACLALKKNRFDTAACGDVVSVRACGATPKPELCGSAIARKLEGTTRGALWLSESDAPYTRVLLRDTPNTSVSDALRSALGTPLEAVVETRSLDDVLSWPTQDRPEEGIETRLQASVLRVMRQQLYSYLSDVQVVRIGVIQVDVYFVGRDGCGNLVGLKSLAIET